MGPAIRLFMCTKHRQISTQPCSNTFECELQLDFLYAHVPNIGMPLCSATLLLCKYGCAPMTRDLLGLNLAPFRSLRRHKTARKSIGASTSTQIIFSATIFPVDYLLVS